MKTLTCNFCGDSFPDFDVAHVCSRGPYAPKFMTQDPIRQAFETVCFPNFETAHGLRRKPTGEYVSDALEDHWQTFQEGWEEAIKHLTNKQNSCYTDIVSNGGMDPR